MKNPELPSDEKKSHTDTSGIIRRPDWSFQQERKSEVDLMAFIKEKLLAEMPTSIDITKLDELREIIREMFQAALIEENIILSRPERNRWFEKIANELIESAVRNTRIITFTLQENGTPAIYKPMTVEYLATQVCPYLSAIEEIQRTIDEIKGFSKREIVVKEVKQQSPISISLDGAAETVKIIKDTVVRWRREHEETMALLLEHEKQAEIESKKAEIFEKRVHAERERAEAIKQREEAEKLRIENKKLQLEVFRAKIQLALDILDKVAPALTEAERIGYLVKLLPPLNILTSSNLEMAGD